MVRYVKSRHKRPRRIKLSKDTLYLRDHGKCQYCNLKIRAHEATVDHVTPKSRGGKNEWTNVVLACGPCNQKKGSLSVKEAGMHLTIKPRQMTTIDPQVLNNELWQFWLPK